LILINLIIISLAVSSFSYTISQSNLFQPIRFFFLQKFNFIGKLISCTYCLSHWISFLFTSIYFKLISYEFLIISFAAITLSMIWVPFISKAVDFMPSDD